MFKHFIIAFNVAVLAGTAQAGAPATDTRLSRMELKECIAATHADEQLYTVELVGGSKVEIAKSQDGRPTSIRILHANGEESLVDSYDALAAQDLAPEGGDALPADTRLAQRSQMQRVLSNHFRTVLRKHCKRMQQKDGEAAPALKPGQRSEPDPSTEWLLWPELVESRSYWFNEARWQVEDTFYAGMDDWSAGVAEWVENLKDKQNELPACSAVRDDCRASCDRIGAYAGGVVCGGLAAVASALSAGIGVSVGVYCGGRVLLKIEECRFNCVVPGVPCN